MSDDAASFALIDGLLETLTEVLDVREVFELFGFERGAFTGATQSKPGQIEQAAGGVLFLDLVIFVTVQRDGPTAND